MEEESLMREIESGECREKKNGGKDPRPNYRVVSWVVSVSLSHESTQW